MEWCKLEKVYSTDKLAWYLFGLVFFLLIEPLCVDYKILNCNESCFIMGKFFITMPLGLHFRFN